MIVALLLLQAAAAAAAPAHAPTPAPAPWTVVQRVNGANTATSTSAWSNDGKARLVVRCDATSEKIVSIQFSPRLPFAAASPRPVSIKADDGGWLGTNWQFPGNGAFVSQDVIVTNLAVTIAQGHILHVRVIDPDNVAIDAEFNGPGEAPIRKVLAACDYAFGVSPPRSPVPLPAAPKSEAEDE